jgi:hypothetical protein
VQTEPDDIEEPDEDEEPDEPDDDTDEEADGDEGAADAPADEPKTKAKAKPKPKADTDIDALVEAKVKELTKGQAPPTTGGPDGGIIESAVSKVLAAKEHDDEHARLKTQTTQEPRKLRKGFAKLVWGE